MTESKNSVSGQVPRRVLHVLNSLERSGMEMMLLNSFAEWCRLGYRCDVLATAQNIGPLADQMQAAGYGIHHIPFRNSGRLLPRARFVQEFYRLCGSGYDVVHLHTEAGPPVYALLAKLAGVRRIAVTPHNTFRFEGFLRARKRCERLLVRMLGGHYGMISEGVKACEWERFRNKGVRISNWIDTSRFRPPTEEERAEARKSVGVQPSDFVIVSIGNCNAYKNHSAILKAISMLPAAKRCCYLHIGREDAEQSERKLAAELSIENKVRFVGSQADTLPFLWSADVFAMPSLIEGLSIAAIEAIAAGAPTLFSNIPGLTEAAAGAQGSVFISAAPESVAEGLSRVIAGDTVHLRKNAMNDSDIIRERFSIQFGVRSIAEGLYA